MYVHNVECRENEEKNENTNKNVESKVSVEKSFTWSHLIAYGLAQLTDRMMTVRWNI